MEEIVHDLYTDLRQYTHQHQRSEEYTSRQLPLLMTIKTESDQFIAQAHTLIGKHGLKYH